jgi:hypothetical protein
VCPLSGWVNPMPDHHNGLFENIVTPVNIMLHTVKNDGVPLIPYTLATNDQSFFKTIIG